MTRPLLIGIGNPIRGDDGLGPRIAMQIAEQMPEVDVLSVHQLTPELAELIAAATRVVFIDAAVDVPPGELRCRNLTPHGGADLPALSHHVGPELLLALAKQLFGNCPPAMLITAGAHRLDLAEQLSRPLEMCIPRLMNEIRRALDPESLGG